MVKNPPVMQELQETQVHSLGWEDPLEEDRTQGPLERGGELMRA